MSQTVSEMFGYERESDDDTIIDNYDDSSSDMPSTGARRETGCVKTHSSHQSLF